MLRKKWLLRTIIAGCAASCAQTVIAADTLVRQFNAGDGAAAVGIAPAVEDVELTGPQALTSDADGNLFVLDQINGRILRFDPKQPGGDPSVLKMPADVQPNDLIVRKSRAFSLEEFGRRQLVNLQGLPLFVASPEDIVIAKLEWSKLAQSQRHIQDVAAILRVRWESLDRTYLEKWIRDLNLETEWSDARSAAGM
jgi:hypothetical protein